MNPIAGKGWNPGWKIDEALPIAVAFYRELEDLLDCRLYRDLLIERCITNAKEYAKIQSKRDLLDPWVEDFSDEAVIIRGGRLFTRSFLDASRAFFEKEGLFRIDAEPTETTVWATGAEGLIERGFTHRSAKGQIITVKADSDLDHMIVKSGKWIMPEGSGHFSIGATYEWDQLDSQPTDEARDSLLIIAEDILGMNVILTDHRAGIRPILRQSKPLIGRMSENTKDYFFNGLGSKGSVYAPMAARALTSHIVDNTKIPECFDLSTFLS